MDKKIKEKANLELTLKTLLYCIEDESEQNKVVKILEDYNNNHPDGRIKDLLQKGWCKLVKKDYYEKIDFLINDILDGRLNNSEKKDIQELINKLFPAINNGKENWFKKLIGLFDWS